MPVNYEVKGMLARLLATEDIVVEHRKVQTACFDVQKRVLTLPMWEKASNTVYDLLLSHEAGHALYTPNEDWTETHKIPPQFVNVVEDARIEKMLKRRYAGLAKTFFNGYRELSDDDFFSLEGEDVEQFNLADRANLYFKIGNHLNLTFTPEEQSIVDLISECETFNDTLEAAEILYKYCKDDLTNFVEVNMPAPTGIEVVFGDSSSENNQSDQSNKQTIQVEMPPQSQPSPSDSSEDGSKGDSEKSSRKEREEEQQNKPTPAAAMESPGATKGSDIHVKTVEALDKAIEKLANLDSFENTYIETPNVNVDEIIIPNKDVHRRCTEAWSDLEYEVFREVDREYMEFKRSAQKEVNYLVKEFERRKAADAYTRASTARTGVLDCSKLHTYKYNDDLFKKITTLPDGKNHGLIFVLDWSGSMSEYLHDTVKQLFNLIWFCKKLSIPFEVYSFTTEYPYIKYGVEGKPTSRKPSYKEADGIVQVASWFSLMNFFTSKTSTSALETQMRNIFRIAYLIDESRLRSQIKYRVPMGLGLSGTPLCETFISLQSIIPKFQKENKVQKVQCVILTDGDACGIKYHREYTHHNDKSKTSIGTATIGQNTILRNRKTGRTYTFQCAWWDIPNVFLRNLADMFPDTNLIGIRLVSSRDASSFIRRYIQESKLYNKTMEQWRKEKAFTIKTSGYESYFGICSNTLSQETEFNVTEDASKSQIKNAFMKSLKIKKMNKRILGEFIELIA